MRVYLAAAFGRQAELRGYRADLEAAGHTVTSRWLDENPTQESTHATWRDRACDDVEDIQSSGLMISFTEGVPARGGRHVEFGIALQRDLPLVLVGPVEHVFHTLANERWDTWEAFLAGTKSL